MLPKRKQHKIRENGTVYLIEITLGDDIVYKVVQQLIVRGIGYYN